MKIFITGATGYVGSQLASALRNSGHEVRALVRTPSAAKFLEDQGIEGVPGDVTQLAAIQKGMKDCEVVFHLAAFARLWARPRDVFYCINVDGTRNILDAAMRQRVKKLVYTSSTAVFGHSFREPICENDPRTIGFNSDYDLSKCMAEKLVMDYAASGLDATIVNPSRIYGAGRESYSNPFSRMLIRVLEGKLLPVPHCPDVIANYSYIHDVVNGHMLAMQYGNAGERYILGGENISYGQLFDTIREFIPRVNLVGVPKPLLKIIGCYNLLRFFITKKQPAFTPAAIERYFRPTAFTSEKAVTQLNYRITPFKEGIQETIQSLQTTCHEPSLLLADHRCQ